MIRLIGIAALVENLYHAYLIDHPNFPDILEQCRARIAYFHQIVKNHPSGTKILTPHSEAFLFNLEGLVQLFSGGSHDFVRIYRILEDEKQNFRRLARLKTKLLFIPTHRQRNSLQVQGDVLIARINFYSHPWPDDYFKLLFRILFHRILNKKIPRIWRLRLKEFVENNSVHGKGSFEMPHQPIPFQDPYLRELFEKLNAMYFQDQLSLPTLEWSKNWSVRRLGFYDYTRNRIVISRVLREPAVPYYVLESVLYHEMLHMLVPFQKGNSYRRYHHSRFRELESRYEHSEHARKWLNEEYPSLMKQWKRKKPRN